MSRGNTDFDAADKAMKDGDLAFISYDKQKFIFEGVGEVIEKATKYSQGKKFKFVQIFVITPEKKLKTIEADWKQFAAFKEAGLAPYAEFEVWTEKSDDLDASGNVQYTDKGTIKQKYTTNVVPTGKRLTIEEMAEKGEEVDIDSIPF